MRAFLTGDDYLRIVRQELSQFLDAAGTPKLAFYNAGTDIVEGDPLGHLRVSTSAVAERDRYVVDTLARRGIPTVIVTSGGYSKASYQLIAQLALYLASKSMSTVFP